MLFRFLILVHVCVAFPFKCPEPAQWSLRARSHCPDPFKYFCLKNDLINGYSENCTVFDFLKSGRKHVIRGGLDADFCSKERFQPPLINFYTNVSTNCIFLKSACNEEGQVVNNRGDQNTDNTCKCDYMKGYDFLVKPRNECFCLPSEEDCSCYLKKCPDSTFKLSPDYDCIHSRMNISMSQCRSMTIRRDNKDEKQSQTQYISRKHNITDPVIWKLFAWISTFVFCIVYIVIIICTIGVLCGNDFLNKYYRKAYFIDMPPNDISCIEGQSVYLKYKLLIDRFPVLYKRNDAVVGNTSTNTTINQKEKGRSKTLEILAITQKDSGDYCLEAAGIKSKPTQLAVRPMFKQALSNVSTVEGSDTIFKCETEEENSPVEWFKDGIKMTGKKDNIKMEILTRHIYKLTIKSTRVDDAGQYSIRKNGICSKAVLEVKGMFKQTLANIITLEGSDTIFKCVTEKQNSPVEWLKDGNNMANIAEKITMEILPGYIYKLTITNSSFRDTGNYTIRKNGIFSEAKLQIKAMFRQALTNVTIVEGSDTVFKCETEKENSPIIWLKDGKTITDKAKNIKMETLPGQMYILTIAPTRLQDKGHYSICKNGIFSEAVLEVKAMFKQSLKNITIWEGSDAVFECETEIESSPVEWLKDGNKLKQGVEKITMEEIPGHMCKLTIRNTQLQDTGKYSIRKNGIYSNAALEVKAMFKKELSNVTNLEGSSTTFECETEEKNSPVEWFKDGNKLTANTPNIKMESEGYSYKLTITTTSILDKGEYSILKNGVHSKAVLDVIELFKRPLKNRTSLEGTDTILECETEKENGHVKWFKDGNKMTDETKNIKMETLSGYIYKLTISSTSRQDKGKYSITKNGIRSEAALEVTALFKKPLKKVTVMEGLDVQLKCETEEVSGSVKWFKDQNPITVDTGNLQRQNLPGHVYTLIISPASLQDSGRYRIEKNGICSEAVLDVKEMPETIKQMSNHDREEFLKATKSGTAKRYNIRVMIVGKGQVGKTCLLRRLINESIDDVESTDGLDILRRKCRIDVDTGEWNLSTPDEDYYSSWSGQNKQYADCGFWDFAGQREFYATHQTFLSSNAVYLLVVDISEKVTKKTYNDMIVETYDSIGEYIEFWLDNIHCYSTDVVDGSIQYNKNMHLNPPVIIVCTGMDKIPLVEIENRKQNFLHYLSEIFSTNAKRSHLREVHFLSNKCPSDNGKEFKTLRTDIFNNAKTSKNWGDNLPTRWLVLEKEIYRKISEEKYTISYDDAIVLATNCSFPGMKETTSELNSFLKYEHDIGNIIFFEDVNDFIVLDPKWLVDVFKCFVSNRYKPELIHMPEWSELEKNGKLLINLIVKLLDKVQHLSLTKHTNFILKIMEKFDIIVRPINDSAKEVFYMPCMIKAVTLNGIIKDIGAEDWTKTSWFCLEFDFLPPSYFNHILVSFVKEMKLRTKMNNQLCIYRNIGLFDINEEGTKVLIICLSKNSIAVQILQWKCSGCYVNIINKLLHLVCSMQLRYRINIKYKKQFKCSDGIYYKDEGRVDFDTVLRRSEYLCREDKKVHSTEEICTSWFTKEDLEEEYEKIGGKMCHGCVKMSVYKCYDCSIVLCTNCAKRHTDATISLFHYIQPVNDSYILNCILNFESIISRIRDIKCLSEGSIAILTDGSKLLIYSVNGNLNRAITLKDPAGRIAVVDTHTVIVSLSTELRRFCMAKVNFNQKHVELISNDSFSRNLFLPIIHTDNQLYVAVDSGIIIMDMYGIIQRRIKLGFNLLDMCYDTCTQHIYCINSNHELICIDREGKHIFTFTDPNMRYSHRLTIVDQRNVLVLCVKKNHNKNFVIKVDSIDKSSEVVITHIQSTCVEGGLCICFHRSTNSVVIGDYETVYLYKKETRVRMHDE